jgi:hypothetical protein
MSVQWQWVAMMTIIAIVIRHDVTTLQLQWHCLVLRFCPRVPNYHKVHIYLECCPIVGIGTPRPLSRLRVCPPRTKRGGHTRLRLRGWGSPNSDDWRKNIALCLLCANYNKSWYWQGSTCMYCRCIVYCDRVETRFLTVSSWKRSRFNESRHLFPRKYVK